MRVLKTVTLLLLSAISARQAIAQCPGQGWWDAVTPIPGPRWQTSAAVVGGKAYVFGDYNYSPDNDSAFAYDPQSDTWQQLAPMLTGRGQTAAAEAGGIIFVFGGNNCYSNCWRLENEAYDPQADTWSASANMLGTPRGLLSAAAVDGKIYVMGGANSYYPATFDYNHVYDPATDTWTEGPALLHPRSHHAAAVLDGKIYLVGGRWQVQHNEPHSRPEVDVFDPATGQWSEAAPLPTPRMVLSAVALNGRIYAIGGIEIGPDGQGSTYADLVEEYDPQLDCWRTVTPLAYAQGEGATAAINRRILVFGGINVNPDPTILDGVLSGYPLPLPSGLFGDLNDDGVVDVTDLALMRALLPACSSADINGSGGVDVNDFLTVLQYWGDCQP